MPNDNIERAIQRGAGKLEGETLDEVTFEGYGPGGVGVLIQVVTSNRNRIVSEIRHMMSKNGGNMAETGAVGWMFHRKGDIVVPKEQADEDKMLGIVLDAGAEDLRDDGSAWEVTTPPEAMEKVREALSPRASRRHRRKWLGAAELREADRHSGAADAAHGGNARRSRRRAARLRQFRHRREGNSGGRCQLAASVLAGTTRAAKCSLDLTHARLKKHYRSIKRGTLVAPNDFSRRNFFPTANQRALKTHRFRVLGVDPAVAGATGYGVVEFEGTTAHMLRFGALKLPARRH